MVRRRTPRSLHDIAAHPGVVNRYVFASYHDDMEDNFPRTYLFVCSVGCSTPLGEWAWHPTRSKIKGDHAWLVDLQRREYREHFGRGAGRIGESTARADVCSGRRLTLTGWCYRACSAVG